MRRYWIVTATLLAALLAFFLLVEWLQIPLLVDPRGLLGRGGWVAAMVGLALLVGDVLLPVPASLVMVANGAVFGVVVGSVLSLAGSLGAALFGFWLGRRGGPLLARLVSEDERLRADALLGRWGPLAVLVTRPVPIVAETVALLAGASSLGWWRFGLAALAGTAPASVLYALTGATAANFDNFALIFGLVLVISALIWALGRSQSSLRSAD